MADNSVPISVAAVTAYESTRPIFDSVLKEVKQLASKKAEAIMSELKVSQINRILVDIKAILDPEPESKFLDLLSDEKLPQIGDAVIIMAQFDAALDAFLSRHRRYVDYKWVWHIVDDKPRPKKGG